MIPFLKNRRETIFFVISVGLFAIIIFFTFRSIRSLALDLGRVTDLEVLRAQSEPVTFNLEKFDSLGIEH